MSTINIFLKFKTKANRRKLIFILKASHNPNWFLSMKHREKRKTSGPYNFMFHKTELHFVKFISPIYLYIWAYASRINSGINLIGKGPQTNLSLKFVSDAYFFVLSG